MVMKFQQYFSYIVAEGDTENTTSLSQVADTLYHIMLYGVHPAMSGIPVHLFSGDKNSFHR